MIELTIRIIFSLLIVLALMWGLAKLARRPLAGRGGGALAVTGRAQLTRNASVAVVRVGDRALVLGVTDQQVSLLAEADPASVEAPAPATGEVREPISIDELTRPAQPAAPAATGLAGSALSPATWRQAVAAVRKGRGR